MYQLYQVYAGLIIGAIGFLGAGIEDWRTFYVDDRWWFICIAGIVLVLSGQVATSLLSFMTIALIKLGTGVLWLAIGLLLARFSLIGLADGIGLPILWLATEQPLIALAVCVAGAMVYLVLPKRSSRSLVGGPMKLKGKQGIPLVTFMAIGVIIGGIASVL